jgi:hypothetical protein
MHGFAGWFTANLGEGVTLSGAPPGLRTWSHAFWPLLRPVPLEQGMVIGLDLTAFHPPRIEPLWSWSTKVRTTVPGDPPLAEFVQDMFGGLRLLLHATGTNSSEHRPRLTGLGRIEHFILGWFDGRKTIAEIASRLLDEHPDAVESLEDAEHLIRRTLLRHKVDGHVVF